MAAANGAERASGDGALAIKPPADVVIPPPGVREAIHKSADFIHRRSPAMEAKLRERSGKDPKFAFLNPEDPYYAYFAWYLQQLNEGKDPAAGDAAGARIAKDNKPKGPVEPEKYRFAARMPNISAKDLEILKLTAMYTARNGENWLKELRHRESGNFQFDFLRNTHSFYTFFQDTVQQYRILLDEKSTVDDRVNALRQNKANRFRILEDAKKRSEFNKHVTQQKEKEDKKAEDQRREYASIDWHDFTIIATVTFDEADDAAELPPPTSLNDLQSASLEQKAEVSLSRRLEEAAPDEQTYYNVSQGYGGYPPVPTTPAPPVQPAYHPPPPDHRAAAQKAEEERQQREREQAARSQAAAKAAPGAVRIRNDYVPRAAAKNSGPTTVLCPNCNTQIPADEIAEHIRIELLDPRWKEQRAKTDSRYATTINTVDVANNLKRFASMRDDIYDGATGMPLTEEEIARRKKAATSYDGQPDPAKDAIRIQEMQSMNVQEQLRRIQERHGGR